MFLVSAIGIALFSIAYHLHWMQSAQGMAAIVISAACATLLEAVTPWGLVNISVPIGTAFITILGRVMIPKVV
jgi:dolichol kinase